MLSPDRCHTSVHMALELQTTPDPLMFVLVLNIQAPGAVKHQCSALMEKGGWKGHSSEGEERQIHSWKICLNCARASLKKCIWGCLIQMRVV